VQGVPTRECGEVMDGRGVRVVEGSSGSWVDTGNSEG
jgi:hypothetical protein